MHAVCETAHKVGGAELLSVLSDGLWVPLLRGASLYCVDEGLLRLLCKEDPRDAVPDGFQGAPASVSNDGTAAGLGLERHNAKILFAGENKLTTGAVELKNGVIALPPQKLNIVTGRGLNFR